MHCANPECGHVANDLTTGVLRLIELDVPPEQRVTRSDSGFPICAVRSRYFWLCEQCCEVLSIRRWTGNGLIFELRTSGSSIRKAVQEIGLPVARAAHGPQLLMGRTA
jgi:hypothetical protein